MLHTAAEPRNRDFYTGQQQHRFKPSTPLTVLGTRMCAEINSGGRRSLREKVQELQPSEAGKLQENLRTVRSAAAVAAASRSQLQRLRRQPKVQDQGQEMQKKPPKTMNKCAKEDTPARRTARRRSRCARRLAASSASRSSDERTFEKALVAASRARRQRRMWRWSRSVAPISRCATRFGLQSQGLTSEV